MKRNLSAYFATIALFSMLAVPVQLAAQDKQNHKHHQYQLVDMGTFGGPQSYFNPGSGNEFGNFAQVLNSRGAVAGSADTRLPDPFPNFCFNDDCFVSHAFRWKNGVRTDLGTLPGGASSAAEWIGASGLIAGLSENGEIDPLVPGFPEVHAVLWRHGRITDLGTLPEGGYESIASAVDSDGRVVGLASNTIPDANSMLGLGYQTRAFIWDKENGMQDLGTLPGGTDAQAFLINQHGQVVGESYTSSAPGACASVGLILTTDAFIWDKKNGIRDLGNFGGTCTQVSDLNNQGQVTGSSDLTGDQSVHAFLWDKENGMRDLGGGLGGDFTGAFVINDDGHAAGFAYLPGDIIFHATLWKHVGDMADLGTLGNDECSFATSINAKEQVVGGSFSDCTSQSPNFRAFLWEEGSLFDLNALVPSGSSLYLQLVETINDRGEIAGTGVDASGNQHAFLLIPCDESHAGVEGCDYSMVDTSAQLKARPSLHEASTTKLPALRRGANRFHFPALGSKN